MNNRSPRSTPCHSNRGGGKGAFSTGGREENGNVCSEFLGRMRIVGKVCVRRTVPRLLSRHEGRGDGGGKGIGTKTATISNGGQKIKPTQPTHMSMPINKEEVPKKWIVDCRRGLWGVSARG